MSRKLRVVDFADVLALHYTKQCLKSALEHAKGARAHKTADKIRSALKSVDGAIRHAQRARDHERLG